MENCNSSISNGNSYVSDPSNPTVAGVAKGKGSPNYLENAYDVKFTSGTIETEGEEETENGEDTSAQDDQVSILRQWLRKNNPYSI
jgi:hypothetical protein